MNVDLDTIELGVELVRESCLLAFFESNTANEDDADNLDDNDNDDDDDDDEFTFWPVDVCSVEVC
jgi:hypothetical protein